MFVGCIRKTEKRLIEGSAFEFLSFIKYIFKNVTSFLDAETQKPDLCAALQRG